MGKEPSLEENINQEVEVDFPWVHHATEDFIFKILFFLIEEDSNTLQGIGFRKVVR